MVVITELTGHEMSILYVMLQTKINDLMVTKPENRDLEKIQELTDLRDKFI